MLLTFLVVVFAILIYFRYLRIDQFEEKPKKILELEVEKIVSTFLAIERKF